MFVGDPADLDEVGFAKREYFLMENFSWKPFKSDKKMDVDTINELLKAKQRELAKLKEESRKEKKPCQTKPLSWEEKVNMRRRLVADCLLQQNERNLAEVVRFTGCSFGLVKRVANDLAFEGVVSSYSYPNQKTSLQLNQLDKSISMVNGSCATIADLKRRNSSFSRKFIARQLKKTGHR